MNSLVAVNDLKPFDLPETGVKSEPSDYVQCLPKTNKQIYPIETTANSIHYESPFVLAAFNVGVY